MRAIKTAVRIAIALLLCCAGVAHAAPPFQQPQDAAPPAVTRRIGAIKAISGSVITLAPDSGPEVSVTNEPGTKIVRIAPGEKNLKNATPISLQDLQVGDRILVGGKISDDGKSLNASSIVVMKRSDVDARQEQARQDWQKRGVGGIVSATDAANDTVTISVTGFAGTKKVVIHTTNDTVIRRYAPDSVKFDDAKPSNLKDVHPGDQLRARGNRSADSAELTAEEIVTGNFRNVAGTVNAVDASAGTLTVQDLLSKKPVTVRVTAESQLHMLPPELAQRIAARLKGLGAGQSGNGASPAPPAELPSKGGQAPQPTASAPRSAAGGAMRTGGAPDFQQMLSRAPVVALGDLHKGDAVMIVATEGASTGTGVAITLLSGVEAILQAAPSGSQGMILTPWSLGGAAGDAGSQE
jgi:hypothetical protein